MGKYEKGKIVTGYVTGIEKYGIFVGLDEYYSGLIHISEISNGFVKNVNNYVHIGETIRVKVVESDDDAYQVKLSIKDINYRLNKKTTDGIEETPSGFSLLADNIDSWIAKKILEINKREKK